MNQNSQNNQNNQNSQSTQNDQGQKITFLPQHGHYRHLRVYQVTEMIYDITFYFTQHYLQKGDRTIDQMVQAARSGKQNIAEGNQAAATSSETEIKLTNVAKASLEELLDDYLGSGVAELAVEYVFQQSLGLLEVIHDKHALAGCKAVGLKYVGCF